MAGPRAAELTAAGSSRGNARWPELRGHGGRGRCTCDTAPVLIRSATAVDASALGPMFAQWGHEQAAEAIAARLVDWEQTPRADVFVAALGGVLAGVAAVAATPHLARPGRTARLAALVVAADYRRRGVATALLRAAEQRAREWDCDRLELTSSRQRAAAHAFYEAQGYEEQSERHARYLRPL